MTVTHSIVRKTLEHHVLILLLFQRFQFSQILFLLFILALKLTLQLSQLIIELTHLRLQRFDLVSDTLRFGFVNSLYDVSVVLTQAV